MTGRAVPKKKTTGGGMGRIKVNMHHPPSPCHFIVGGCDNNDGAAASTSSAADQLARLLCIKGGGEFGPSCAQLGRGHTKTVGGNWRDISREHRRDVVDDGESNRPERCLLIIEYPMTLARKVRARV